MIRALAPIALIASPVVAQDIAVSGAALGQCLTTRPPEQCVGLVARLCEAETGAGSEGICRGAENAVWLRRIAVAETALRHREPDVQARAERLGWPDPLPSVDRIAEGFAAYREAACSWRAAAWDGIHAGVEEYDCRMRLNAAQALWLEARLDD